MQKKLLVMNTTIGKDNYCVDYGKVVMSFLKMTSHHYLQPPIIIVLLTCHEHGAPFLRVVLLVLYSSQDSVDEPLILNPDSSKWGCFIYRDNIDQKKTYPVDEVKWFNIVSIFLVILCIGGDSLVSIASVV